MRINRYVATASQYSRRTADKLIMAGRVTINGKTASTGDTVVAGDRVALDGTVIAPAQTTRTIALNKPVGYVCSRDGQGSPTVYELLPHDYQTLQLVGRLDKDSSGLLLLTTDGDLSHQLTHPSFQKVKTYRLLLKSPLTAQDETTIASGVQLSDGISRLKLSSVHPDRKQLQVRMTEGRNRQIRRTFEALGHSVISLHRVAIGAFHIGNLAPGEWSNISPQHK
jgi:23S rRNA pseudouridine2605 synthase